MQESHQLPIVPEILYETDAYLICYKPHGYATLPRNKAGESDIPTLYSWLVAVRPEQAALAGYRKGEAGILYRLDNETAGCVLVAKTAEAARQYKVAQEAGAVAKHYVAKLIAAGHMRPSGACEVSREAGVSRGTAGAAGADREGAVSLRIRSTFRSRGTKGRWIECLAPSADLTPHTTEVHMLDDGWVEAIIKRGARHQIRVHLAQGLGRPIVGDSLYGYGPTPWREGSVATAPEESLQLYCVGVESLDPTLFQELAYRLKIPMI